MKSNSTKRVAGVFEAISHPVRREILEILKDGEMPAASLAEPFKMSFPAISQHLGVLKGAGLVNERREGRQRIYQLHPKPLREVHDWINEFEEFWSSKLDNLGEYLRRKHGKN